MGGGAARLGSMKSLLEKKKRFLGRSLLPKQYENSKYMYFEFSYCLGNKLRPRNLFFFSRRLFILPSRAAPPPKKAAPPRFSSREDSAVWKLYTKGRSRTSTKTLLNWRAYRQNRKIMPYCKGIVQKMFKTHAF